jgi:hypothetical protein
MTLKYRSTALAGSAYAVLVLIMWGAFNPHSGFPYETGFPWMSDTGSLLGGFLYRADPLRIHTNTFYHLSYVIGEALGIGGSYVPYQIVYAMLWWARGFLVFLLMRKFFPGCFAVCYAAGALVVMHASDAALQWVGQLNQFGFIFWMLLAFYFLTLASESNRLWLFALYVAAACFLLQMSLLSYESQLFLILVFPLAVVMRKPGWRKLAVMLAVWYTVPAFYVLLTVRRYAATGGGTYQQSVLRKGWGLHTLVSDWAFNIAASLEFWNWPRGGWYASEGLAVLLSLGAAAVFAVGGILFVRWAQLSGGTEPFVKTARTWWTLLIAGLVLLVLSFPAYLLLDSARGLWRTQFLSGIGSGMVLTATIGLISHLLSWRPARVFAFFLLGATVTYFGSVSAIQKGAFHRWVWERHRAAILKVLKAAPSVRPNTIIVLINVPKNDDPFGDNMWFDMALRLVYPGTPVMGVYFYADGTPAPSAGFVARGTTWKWNGTGFGPLVLETSVANTIVVDDSQPGNGSSVATMPAFVCRDVCGTELYNPTSRVTGSASPRAVRRYRPYDQSFGGVHAGQ